MRTEKLKVAHWSTSTAKPLPNSGWELEVSVVAFITAVMLYVTTQAAVKEIAAEHQKSTRVVVMRTAQLNLLKQTNNTIPKANNIQAITGKMKVIELWISMIRCASASEMDSFSAKMSTEVLKLEVHWSPFSPLLQIPLGIVSKYQMKLIKKRTHITKSNICTEKLRNKNVRDSDAERSTST